MHEETAHMIDFHVHVFPKDYIERRWELVKEDPNFSAIYSNEKARLASERDILSYMDRHRLERIVVFGFTWLNNSLNREHNGYIIELSRKDERIIPFCTVNIFSSDWEETALEALESGAKGFGEIGYYTGSGNLLREEWKPFMELLKEHGKPLILHVNEPVGHNYPGKADISLKEIYTFITKFKKNTVILAHLGGGIFLYSFMKEVAEAMENVFFDTAACPFLYSGEILKVFSMLHQEDKILFGTDYPLLEPPRYRRWMEKTMGEELLIKIAVENPKRLIERL